MRAYAAKNRDCDYLQANTESRGLSYPSTLSYIAAGTHTHLLSVPLSVPHNEPQ